MIGVGNFVALLWFRERVVRWQALTASIFGLVLFGLIQLVKSFFGALAGEMPRSLEVLIYEIGGGLALLVLILSLAALLVSLMPAEKNPLEALQGGAKPPGGGSRDDDAQ